ncbi:flagellar biosynthesis protein FliQ [Oryzihumus leptocrescens]|uniref:Flagellar biosynthetic protein FliQ n=1 Tax=Oryzihumus leptocrescens TaxID=297536 RepID=A0A542Z9L0_9MICO|nr:flagellar biosynthesis protein FliQ [Oryzihumus leptocrescens]TQL56993.1 flagellar biosynthetic protein FliQ [Oryzihumus leptocrescens]
MTDTAVVHLAVQSMIIAMKLAAPILIVSLAIGFGISLMQSVTQIQEVTLSFVPKLLGVAIVILLSGHWMLSEVVDFTRQLFDSLPQLLSG